MRQVWEWTNNREKKTHLLELFGFEVAPHDRKGGNRSCPPFDHENPLGWDKVPLLPWKRFLHDNRMARTASSVWAQCWYSQLLHTGQATVGEEPKFATVFFELCIKQSWGLHPRPMTIWHNIKWLSWKSGDNMKTNDTHGPATAASTVKHQARIGLHEPLQSTGRVIAQLPWAKNNTTASVQVVGRTILP